MTMLDDSDDEDCTWQNVNDVDIDEVAREDESH